MLIRAIFKNILSFGIQTEFNMLSAPRYTDHKSHKVNFENINILKFSAIYGANGAGKSNLIKSISLFERFFKDEISLNKIRQKHNKFNSSEDSQLMALEFIAEEKRYLYAVETQTNVISKEEIYRIDKNGNQELIFKRETNIETLATTIDTIFLDVKNEKDAYLIEIFIDNMLKTNKISLEKFSELKHENLGELKNIAKWFEKLIIIEPNSRLPHIPYLLNKNENLLEYFKNSMHSFNVGIDSIELSKHKLTDIVDDKKQCEEIIETLDNGVGKLAILKDEDGEQITIVKEEEEKNKEYFAYGLKTIHSHNDKETAFSFEEESDGTKRLFDLLSAFNTIVNEDSVVIIDEVERSIHPVLIKKVLEKLTLNSNIKGQFLFTTHESNLLDLALLRRDEIWFVEKNLMGNTEFYPLSDYQEHKTKDIRKGYLQGRYGAIPFLGNLDDLNWNI